MLAQKSTLMRNRTGVDLVFSEGGAKPSSGSLSQGVCMGAQPPRSYRLLGS